MISELKDLGKRLIRGRGKLTLKEELGSYCSEILHRVELRHLDV